MALQLFNLVGDVLLNGVIPSPDAVLTPANAQPPELTVFAGASLSLVLAGETDSEKIKIHFPVGDTIHLEICFSLGLPGWPGCYLTRRCHSPATYDLQTDWGRVIIREGSPTP